MHMICISMPTPASTEITELLYISRRKKYRTPYGAPFCWRPGAYAPPAPYLPQLKTVQEAVTCSMFL